MSMSISSLLGRSQDDSKKIEPESQESDSASKDQVNTPIQSNSTDKNEVKQEHFENKPSNSNIHEPVNSINSLSPLVSNHVSMSPSGHGTPLEGKDNGASSSSAPYTSALHKYQLQENSSIAGVPHQHHHHSHSHKHMHSHAMLHSHLIDAPEPTSNSPVVGRQPSLVAQEPGATNSPEAGSIMSTAELPAPGSISIPAHEMQQSSIARDGREVSAGPSSVGLHTHVHHALPDAHFGSRHTHVHSATGPSHFHHHDPQQHHHATGNSQTGSSNNIDGASNSTGNNNQQQSTGDFNKSLLHHSQLSSANNAMHPYYFVSSNEKLVVGSYEVYESIKHFPRHKLGSMIYVLDDYSTANPHMPSRDNLYNTDEYSGEERIPITSTDPRVFDLKDGQLEHGDKNAPIIPRFEGKENSVFEVRIPRKYLSRKTNPNVDEQQRLWGTDIYTDDSDVVAVLYHMGVLPLDDKEEKEKEVEAETEKEKEKEEEKVDTKEKEESKEGPKEESKDKPDSEIGDKNEKKEDADKLSSPKEANTEKSECRIKKSKKSKRKLKRKLIESLAGYKRAIDNSNCYNDTQTAAREADIDLYGDLVVTLLILPRLIRYSGSYRNGLYSRDWGAPRVPHDGVSYAIAGIRFMEPDVLADIPRGKKARIDQWNGEFQQIFADVLESQKKKVNSGQEDQVTQVEEYWMLNGNGYPKFKIKGV